LTQSLLVNSSSSRHLKEPREVSSCETYFTSSEHNGLLTGHNTGPIRRLIGGRGFSIRWMFQQSRSVSAGFMGRGGGDPFRALELPPRAARSKREAKAKAAGLAPATSKGTALPVGSGARAARAGFSSSPRLVGV